MFTLVSYQPMLSDLQPMLSGLQSMQSVQKSIKFKYSATLNLHELLWGERGGQMKGCTSCKKFR